MPFTFKLSKRLARLKYFPLVAAAVAHACLLEEPTSTESTFPSDTAARKKSAVASVTVNPSVVTATLGQTGWFTVVVRDGSGNVLTDRVVTWASSEVAVVTVDGAGLARAVGVGSAVVTATSEGVSGQAQVTVVGGVPGAVADLAVVGVTDTSVTLSFTEVDDGTGQPASYDVRYGVAPISWGSASSVTRGSCATPVLGSAIGARRTCEVLGLASSTGYGFQLVAFRGTLGVDVVFGALSNVVGATTAGARVASVVVSPSVVSLTVGQTQQFTAVVRDGSGNVLTDRVVTWASSEVAVVTVDGAGLARAVGVGSAVVTATSEGVSGQAQVTVVGGVPGAVADLAVVGVTDTSVTLSFTEVDDGTGQPAKYDVRYGVAPISWGSASSVTRGSCATPVLGSAIGARRTCEVLGLASSTGYGFQLVAFRGTLGVDMVFGALSNVVGATTAGARVASVVVSPSVVSLTVGQTQQFTAVVRDGSGNVLTDRVVTWASSEVAVVTVDGAGLARAVGVGSAVVTATSEGVSGQAQVTVTSGGDAEPRYDPLGNILLWFDNFDAYLTDSQLYAAYVTLNQQFIHIDLTAGLNGGPAVRFDWRTKNDCADDSRLIERAFVAATELYLSFWVTYQNGFVWNWSGREPCIGNAKKIFFFWAVSGSRWILVAENGTLAIGNDAVHDPLFRQNAGTPVSLSELGDGRWHRFTFHIRQGSTPSTADGFMKGWIDGQLKWNVSGIVTGNSGGYYLFKTPTTFNTGSPVNQSEWMDNLTIWR